MSDQAPLTSTVTVIVQPTASGSDSEVPVIEAPFDGSITVVQFAPSANVTGVNTNTRKVEVINHRQDGSGSTSVASLQFDSGKNATAHAKVSVTMVLAGGANTVAKGDMLSFKSTHIGSGIADPGGVLKVTFQRA